MVKYRERRDQINQHLSKIEALNNHINETESEMMNLKARYEGGVKDRNKMGIYLLDRNDELCILYERLNVQKEVAAKGEAALVEREDETRKLSLIGAELARKIELQKQRLPQVNQLKIEIDKLEDKRHDLHEAVSKLGAQMENPDDPSRCRNLGGEDPVPEELAKKIEKLEDQLASQEEKLLEKDLVLDEISTLVMRLQAQTMSGKDETYQVTSRINDLTKRLKHITKKTMAKVSELAMHQAQVMSLYQEKSEKEALLAESLAQLESGEIPLDEIEKDYVRAERAKLKREEEKRLKQAKQERQRLGRFVEMYFVLTIGKKAFTSLAKSKPLLNPDPMHIFLMRVVMESCLFLNLMALIHPLNLKKLDHKCDITRSLLLSLSRFNFCKI